MASSSKSLHFGNVLAMGNDSDIQLCRACFGNDGLQTMSDKVLSIFAQVTNTALDTAYNYPKYICSTCLVLLRKLHNFRLKCQQSMLQMYKLALWNKLNTKNLVESNDKKSMNNLSLSKMELTWYTTEKRLTFGNIVKIDLLPTATQAYGQNNKDTATTTSMTHKKINVPNKSKSVSQNKSTDSSAALPVIGLNITNSTNFQSSFYKSNNKSKDYVDHGVLTFPPVAAEPVLQPVLNNLNVSNCRVKKFQCIAPKSASNLLQNSFIQDNCVQTNENQSQNNTQKKMVAWHQPQVNFPPISNYSVSEDASNVKDLNTDVTATTARNDEVNRLVNINNQLNKNTSNTALESIPETADTTDGIFLFQDSNSSTNPVTHGIFTKNITLDTVDIKKEDCDLEAADVGTDEVVEKEKDGCNDELNFQIEETASIKSEIDIIVKEEHLIHPVDDDDEENGVNFDEQDSMIQNDTINKQDQRNIIPETPFPSTSNNKINMKVVEILDSESSSSSSDDSSSSDSSSSDSDSDDEKIEEIDLTIEDENTEVIKDKTEKSDDKATNITENAKTVADVNIESIINIENDVTVLDNTQVILPNEIPNLNIQINKTTTENSNCTIDVEVLPNNDIVVSKTVPDSRAIEGALENNTDQIQAENSETENNNISAIENEDNIVMNDQDLSELLSSIEHLKELNEEVSNKDANLCGKAVVVHINNEEEETASTEIAETATVSNGNITTPTSSNSTRYRMYYDDDDDESSDADDLPDCLIGINRDVYTKDTTRNFKGPENGVEVKKQVPRFVNEKPEKKIGRKRLIDKSDKDTDPEYVPNNKIIIQKQIVKNKKYETRKKDFSKEPECCKSSDNKKITDNSHNLTASKSQSENFSKTKSSREIIKKKLDKRRLASRQRIIEKTKRERDKIQIALRNIQNRILIDKWRKDRDREKLNSKQKAEDIDTENVKVENNINVLENDDNVDKDTASKKCVEDDWNSFKYTYNHPASV